MRSWWRVISKFVLGTSIFVFIGSCQSIAISNLSERDGYAVKEVKGTRFIHQVVESHLSENSSNGVLHVYIEGDGRPWRTPIQVASDPTSAKLPVLALMKRDSNAALYLGRPCYFTLGDSACSPQWWTHRRYSIEVLESLNAVLDVYAPRYRIIRLIGHSGGGALAMLMAAHRKDIDTVVTLAGNLDSQSWTNHHGYSPMIGSLNPINYPLVSSIHQLHYAARHDEVVPWTMIERAVSGHKKNVVFKVIEDADHSCCWEQHWSRILQEAANWKI